VTNFTKQLESNSPFRTPPLLLRIHAKIDNAAQSFRCCQLFITINDDLLQFHKAAYTLYSQQQTTSAHLTVQFINE